jgi:hypothetical protein
MFKRSMLIGLLCIGLIAMLNTEAASRCRIVDGKLHCSDVCAYTFLQGVGNPDVNHLAVCAGLYIEKAEGRCWNQPGNSGQARGTAFFPHITVTDQTLLQYYMLTGDRGSAEVKNLCWDWDSDIYDPILDWVYAHFTQVCPNYNWHFDENSLQIKTIYVYHSAYQEDRNENLYSVSELCRKCDFVSGTGEGGCGFSCSTVSTSQCAGRGLASECLGAVN